MTPTTGPSFDAPTDLSWFDIITRLGPLILTILTGLIAFGALRFQRNEARRKVLTDIMRNFAKCIYHMNKANAARKRREGLIAAYVKPAKPDESTPAQLNVPHKVKFSLDTLMTSYESEVDRAYEAHAAFESETVASRFRFDDRTYELFRHARTEVSKLGSLVNAGEFAAFDVQLVKLKAINEKLTEAARNLRVTRQIAEFLRQPEPEATANKKPNLSQERMGRVMSLVHKRVTSERASSFKVFPPRYLIENPNAARVDPLKFQRGGYKFKLVFQDGESEQLTLLELLAFIHELLFMKFEAEQQLKAIEKLNAGVVEVEISHTVDMGELLEPPLAAALLSNVTLEQVPHD